MQVNLFFGICRTLLHIYTAPDILNIEKCHSHRPICDSMTSVGTLDGLTTHETKCSFIDLLGKSIIRHMDM